MCLYYNNNKIKKYSIIKKKKKFQNTKIKEYEKTQKKINELIGALNKHQSVTDNTINRELNELKMKIENIRDEVTHDMEVLRKKNQTETENTMEGHFSRLEKVEDRISELKDKIEIKGKTEELLVKQLKTYKRNMQELNDSIKRPILRIMGIESELQTTGICNIFNKIITEKFPNLKKVMPIQVQEASRTPNRLYQN
jgi:chromosome segregation ATPase